jgi:hypothetical protein
MGLLQAPGLLLIDERFELYVPVPCPYGSPGTWHYRSALEHLSIDRNPVSLSADARDSAYPSVVTGLR